MIDIITVLPVPNVPRVVSDTYMVTSEELKHIAQDPTLDVNMGEFERHINRREVVVFEPNDHGLSAVFRPSQDKEKEWHFSYRGAQDAPRFVIPRLDELIEERDPLYTAEEKLEPTETHAQASTTTSTMATIWLTYAWEDNDSQDVNFLAQELSSAGIEVKLDRWNIEAGKPLWDQIEQFITSEAECDAWVMYATQNSLGSQACKEEYRYALHRALNERSEAFPIIGLFPGPVDDELVPAGIKTRLYVSTTDADWKERIKAAAEGRAPSTSRPFVNPYDVQRHPVEGGTVVEFRPRAGTWYPFVVAVPLDEKEKLGKHTLVLPGGPGSPPDTSGEVMISYDRQGEVTIKNDDWWFVQPSGEANPGKSFYLFVKEVPSRILFGEAEGRVWTVQY